MDKANNDNHLIPCRFVSSPYSKPAAYSNLESNSIFRGTKVFGNTKITVLVMF